MQLYPPFVYFKWGALLTLISFIPNIHVLGLGLIALGLGLELIDRVFKEKPETATTEDQEA